MKWPPKNGKGAVQAPIPNPLSSQQIKSARAIAQVCDPVPLVCGAQTQCAHLITRLAIIPAGHVHFAAERCSQCGCLLRWIPKPATVERQKLNAFKLAKLSMIDGLSDWERSFVRSIAHQNRLSPRQQEILDRLVAKFLEGKAP
jgi:hypothetical protein